MRTTYLCISAILLFISSATSVQAGNPSLSSQKIVFKQAKKNYVVSAEYPKFSGTSENSEQVSQLNDAVKAYVQRLSSAREGKLVEVGPGVGEEELSSEDLNSVDITCDVVRSDMRFVSIKFERYLYRRGDPHGVADIFGFNYDVQHQKIIKLENLFEPSCDYVKQISEYCDLDLIRQLGGFWSKGEMTKNNLNQFTFSHRSLNIHFSAYQVACYAAGTPEVNISYKKLKGIKKDVLAAINFSNSPN